MSQSEVSSARLSFQFKLLCGPPQKASNGCQPGDASVPTLPCFDAGLREVCAAALLEEPAPATGPRGRATITGASQALCSFSCHSERLERIP